MRNHGVNQELVLDNPHVRGEMIGGIHQSLLEQPGSGYFRGALSHALLHFEISDQLFHVEDAKRSDELYFRVQRDDATTALSVQAYTRTDETRPQRHRDLYAGQLFGRAVMYFDDLYGEAGNQYLRAWWQPGSDNRRMYQTAFAVHDYLEGAARRNHAAFATWTGRQALRHGYEHIDGRVQYCKAREDIRVTFARSASLQSQKGILE
jgi:hypothetical protein